MLRWIPVMVIALAALSPLQGVEIKTAYTRHYQADEIRTVWEYFSDSFLGHSFRTIIASQPDNPTGQYFILKIKGSSDSTPVSARMTLYSTDSKEPSEWTWSLEVIRLDNWLYLGLTGSDWPDEKIQPLAWRLELEDANGVVLAEWKSFLWEQGPDS